MRRTPCCPVLRLAIAVVLVLSACVHHRPVTNLATALTLGVSAAPPVVAAGRELEVEFTVHNSSNLQLSLCSPSGVTTYLQSQTPSYVWPIIIHGWTTDTYCSGPFTLAPGEDKVFRERGGVRRDLPSGPALLVGKISLHCDPRERLRCRDIQLETSRTVSVQAQP